MMFIDRLLPDVDLTTRPSWQNGDAYIRAKQYNTSPRRAQTL